MSPWPNDDDMLPLPLCPPVFLPLCPLVPLPVRPNEDDALRLLLSPRHFLCHCPLPLLVCLQRDEVAGALHPSQHQGQASGRGRAVHRPPPMSPWLNVADVLRLLLSLRGDEAKPGLMAMASHVTIHPRNDWGMEPAGFAGLVHPAGAETTDQLGDNILIFSRGRTEHVGHVREVLSRLRANKLYCAPAKCEFYAEEVEFLGYRVSGRGVTMDPKKVSAITEWPVPKSIHDIQVFLGFANFYRRFIKHYSRVVSPITAALRGKAKGAIEFSDEQTQAFQLLKTAFTSAPILRHFDPSLPTVMEMDASDYVVAGILSQWVALPGTDPTAPPRPRTHRLHPVAFWSRQMLPAERNYEIHDKELLAIVKACDEWRHYLHGLSEPFEILTDHQALEYFQTKHQLTWRQARWGLSLGEFNFRLTYWPGTEGGKPDALTRRTDLHPNAGRSFDSAIPDPDNNKVLLPHPLFVRATRLAPARLHPSYSRSSSPAAEMSPLLGRLRECTASVSADTRKELELSLQDGLLVTARGKFYVPPAEVPLALKTCHDDPVSGHPGIRNTVLACARQFWWPTLQADCLDHVTRCSACLRAKHPRHKPYGYLLPLLAPDRPWGSISMDLIEGLPPCADPGGGPDFDSILVMVDRLTKYTVAVPTRKNDTSPRLAEILDRDVFLHFGLPDQIVSDRGRTFVSAFWQDLLTLYNVKSSLSTAYHPQTDGQTEQMNQSLEVYLRMYCSFQQDDWVRWLPRAQFALNQRTSASTGSTPAVAALGFSPRAHPDLPAATPLSLAGTVEAHADIIRKCQENIDAAAVAAAKSFNRSRIDRSFAEGESVMLRTKHLRTDRPSRKMDNPLAGPFRILGKVGPRAYRLDLPRKWDVHPVFHVSLLEAAPRNLRTSDQAPERTWAEDEREEYEVEAVVDSRRQRNRLQYLVKWVGYADPSWIPAEHASNAKDAVAEFHREQPTKPRPRRV